MKIQLSTSTINAKIVFYYDLTNSLNSSIILIIGKLISGVWKKFKEWWEKEKKPRVVEKAKESVLKKLKESKEKVEEEKGNKSKKAERSGKKLETEL